MTTSSDPRPKARSFTVALALLLALLFAIIKPEHSGDVEEYALTTIALASHASPDIRAADVSAAKALMPAFVAPLAQLEQGMAAGGEVPKPGYYRGHDGRVYTIHFFAYPALAALPFKLLALAHADPMKCFVAVNLAFLFVLGMALLRLFGTPQRAGFGLLLFLLCGGYLYGNWSSPEAMSAAALLAALCLYLTGAPVAAGVLAGAAAMHNPPIVFFAAFAPLLRLCLVWQRGTPLAANLRRALGPRELAGAALTGALFALPVLFNLWAFGVPSIISKVSTAVELASLNRLHAFFFDLNQGMIVGVPAVLAALLVWGWRGPGRAPALTAAAAAFALALAAPALIAHNWNSGSAGVMRYAFWGSMPLLFAFLWRLRQRQQWPALLLAAVLVLQYGTIPFAHHYNPVDFSPLARWVLAHAPRAYNPEPEIFHERVVHAETYLDPLQVDVYKVDGVVRKAMFNLANVNAGSALCGAGQALSPDNAMVDTDRQWRYVSGPIRCTTSIEFAAGQVGLELADGWSEIEHGGDVWNGAWSKAERARLTVMLDRGRRPSALILHGHYFEGNHRTRVMIDGVDLGWQRLDLAPRLPVPPGTTGRALLEVQLEFDAPHLPPPGQADQRRIAFFLQKVTMG